MITIKTYSVTENDYEISAFKTSLANQSSSPESYELIESDGLSDPDSRLEITLPNNCLVLGRDWDRYINYALDHNINIDDILIKRRMGLVSRPDNGVFEGLSVKYPIATSCDRD